MSKTYIVKIKIANENEQLLPGMIATIRLAAGITTDAITVPQEVIFRDADNLTYVYIINAEKKAIRKRITIGGLLENRIVVTSGLQEGDKIITRGQNNIKEGQLLSYN